MGSLHDTALNKLSALLRRKPLTPKQIAEQTGCSKPTAYHRIKALVSRGENVYSLRGKGEGPGPTAKLFGIR